MDKKLHGVRGSVGGVVVCGIPLSGGSVVPEIPLIDVSLYSTPLIDVSLRIVSCNQRKPGTVFVRLTH